MIGRGSGLCLIQRFRGIVPKALGCHTLGKTLALGKTLDSRAVNNPLTSPHATQPRRIEHTMSKTP